MSFKPFLVSPIYLVFPVGADLLIVTLLAVLPIYPAELLEPEIPLAPPAAY
jgi:hypothetical protein